MKIGKPDFILNEYTVDLDKKSGLVSFMAMEENKKNEQWDCDLQLVSNIWIPKKIVSVSKNGSVVQTLDWHDNKINIPLDKNLFHLKNLGVRRGDMGTDLRTQSEYIVTGHEFAPPQDYSESLQRRFSMRKALVAIAITAVLIVAISLLVVYRRMRRNI